MEKSKSKETLSTASELSDKTSNSSKNQPTIDFSYLVNELDKLNQEGSSLLKQSKLEEAKNKYIKGHEKFEIVADKIYSMFTNNEQVDKILSLYKHFLSNIAECFYEEKKFHESIIYDLKLICLEPKNIESIYRLFNSYSKIGKAQQALFYGEILLELDLDKNNKFIKAKNDIENEKLKLIKIQEHRKYRINFIIIMIIFSIVLLYFYRNKKN